LFVCAFGIFLIGKNYALNHTSVIVEKILAKVRLRILDKSRKADLKLIEDIGLAEIHTKLTHNANTISETALLAVAVCQSVIMLFFCALYIAWLSLPAFLGTITLIGLAILYFNKKRKEASTYLKRSSTIQEKLFNKISGILYGFKELKVNKKRNNHYFEDVKKVSQESENLGIMTQLKFVSTMMVSELTFYSLIAGIVFLLPRFGAQYTTLVPKLVTSTLFIMGPIVTIVSIAPLITRANVAISEIYGLENRLDEAHEPENHGEQKAKDFKKITLENIVFNYQDQHGNTLFTLDNINLSINKGELLFIVGGNGSGKSTVLKILTGLYYPEQGNIRLDDRLITRANYQAYRELYSLIFTDFYLFEKLYGLDVIDRDKVENYLKLMELDDKTTLEDHGFTNIKLSTGQKKRLAMITALLFDSQIYVFDELAADQAPDFRKYFYEVLLKDLKKCGKTVVVVSHDDRFFHVADRVIEMDYGRFSKQDA
ncbi:MAG: cyclic peptide export ABC transporter, partial [Desulfobacteraceae bacterium]|nr:cyclic peptide export ABC transporter [Desulfobacteraceae bacterium]